MPPERSCRKSDKDLKKFTAPKPKSQMTCESEERTVNNTPCKRLHDLLARPDRRGLSEEAGHQLHLLYSKIDPVGDKPTGLELDSGALEFHMRLLHCLTSPASPTKLEPLSTYSNQIWRITRISKTSWIANYDRKSLVTADTLLGYSSDTNIDDEDEHDGAPGMLGETMMTTMCKRKAICKSNTMFSDTVALTVVTKEFP